MPGEKQPCPTVAACWSPAMPRMRIDPPKKRWCRSRQRCPAAPAAAPAGTLKRSHSAASQLSAPDVHQQRARGIGRVGRVQLAAGEPPEQEAVDRPEREPTRDRCRTRAGDMIEKPGDLGGGKIRIEQEPGARRDHGLVPACAQSGAGVGGAAILPDDGVMNGLAGRAVPDEGGLALIGDAESGDLLALASALARAVRTVASTSTRSPRDRARPGRTRDRPGGIPAARWQPGRARRRTKSRASRWCPGRWREEDQARSSPMTQSADAARRAGDRNEACRIRVERGQRNDRRWLDAVELAWRRRMRQRAAAGCSSRACGARANSRRVSQPCAAW